MARYGQVQPANFLANFMAGRQAADDERAQGQANALRDTQVERAQSLNALSQNPDATPEQYIRAGDAQTGAALQGSQDRQQATKEAALTHFAQLAQRALAETDPQRRRMIIHQGLQANPGALAAIGGDPAKSASELESLPDSELEQRMQAVAQYAPAQAPIKVGANDTLLDPNTHKPIYTAPGDPKDKETARHNNVMEGIAQQRITAGPESLITPQGLEIAAQQYYADGTLPKGMGRGAASMNAKVINRAAEIAAENGDDAQATVLKRNAFTATRKAQADALKQFTAGKNGNTVRSLNVAVQHLDQLAQLGDALQNNDTPLLNKIGNAWGRQTGSAAPVTFDAMKKVVADELVKAVVGSGGGVADREEAAHSLDSAQSPAQMKEVIANYKGLMAGQLNGLRQQYAEGTGRDDFERFLLPGTKAELEQHSQNEQAPAAQPPAGAAAVQTATGPNGQKLYLRNGKWSPQ